MIPIAYARAMRFFSPFFESVFMTKANKFYIFGLTRFDICHKFRGGKIQIVT